MALLLIHHFGSFRHSIGPIGLRSGERLPTQNPAPTRLQLCQREQESERDAVHDRRRPAKVNGERSIASRSHERRTEARPAGARNAQTDDFAVAAQPKLRTSEVHDRVRAILAAAGDADRLAEYGDALLERGERAEARIYYEEGERLRGAIA